MQAVQFPLAASVLTAASASFMDANPGQFRYQRLQLVPHPFRQVFAGGVLQAWQIVQIVMIKLFVNRFEDLPYLAKITNPTSMRVDLTL